jgi:hypothetical protein
MQQNIKRLVTLVAFSVPGLVQAGSMDVVRAYAKMGSLEQTMSADAASQNLSKTYGGKLDSYLDQLNSDIQTAQGLLRRLPAGRGGMAAANAMPLLIDLTLAAVDTDALDGFSESARRNLRDAIGEQLGSYGDLEDDANAAMDALDDSLGEDTTLYSSPSYRRQDNPARIRIFRDRHHTANKQRRRRVRAGYVVSDRRSKSRRASAQYVNDSGSNRSKKSRNKATYQYDDSSAKRSNRAERREADDKRRERALAKSAPVVDLSQGQDKVTKAFAITEDDFEPLSASAAPEVKKKKKVKKNKDGSAPSAPAANPFDLFQTSSAPAGGSSANPFDDL